MQLTHSSHSSSSHRRDRDLSASPRRRERSPHDRCDAIYIISTMIILALIGSSVNACLMIKYDNLAILYIFHTCIITCIPTCYSTESAGGHRAHISLISRAMTKRNRNIPSMTMTTATANQINQRPERYSATPCRTIPTIPYNRMRSPRQMRCEPS